MGNTTANAMLNCSIAMEQLRSVVRNDFYGNTLTALLVINGILLFLVISNNLLIIFTIARTPSLHGPSNFLILGQAIADIFVGMIIQPSFCAMQFYEMNEVFPEYCHARVVVYNAFGWGICAASFLTLTALIADRFLALHYHLRYKEIVTNTRVGRLLLFIWFCGVSCGIFRVLTVIFFLFAGLCFCLIILLDIYFLVKIFLITRRHSIQIHSHNQLSHQNTRMRRSTNAMYYVFGAFVVSYVPHLLVLLVGFLAGKTTPNYRIAFRVSESFVFLSSLLNTIIYFWRIEGFRVAAKRLFRTAGSSLFGAIACTNSRDIQPS